MKSIKIGLFITLFLLASMALAACSGIPADELAAAAPDINQAQADFQVSQTGNESSGPDPVVIPDVWVEQVPRIDEQGAVVVEITPLKLNEPGSTVEFNVRMNTHSVDLSMDLAKLATLSTDTGKTIQATGWEAPAGGHHVSGKLSFPASLDGERLLDGVNKLTLTLKNVDAPERVFVWEK